MSPAAGAGWLSGELERARSGRTEGVRVFSSPQPRSLGTTTGQLRDVLASEFVTANAQVCVTNFPLLGFTPENARAATKRLNVVEK